MKCLEGVAEQDLVRITCAIPLQANKSRSEGSPVGQLS
jgi:hypothetical protein